MLCCHDGRNAAHPDFFVVRSVVWSALRMGSNTDAFLGGLEYGSISGASEQPLVDRSGGDEENLTSAGLDGEAGHSKSSECQPAR